MDARTGRLAALFVVCAGVVLTLVHNSLDLGQRVEFGNNPPIFATLAASCFSCLTAYGSLVLAERKRASIALECVTLAILSVLAVAYILVWRNIPSL